MRKQSSEVIRVSIKVEMKKIQKKDHLNHRGDNCLERIKNLNLLILLS